jgi:hypothetical protein
LNDGKLIPKVRATTGMYQNVILYIHILACSYFSANLSMDRYLPKMTIWKPNQQFTEYPEMAYDLNFKAT